LDSNDTSKSCNESSEETDQSDISSNVLACVIFKPVLRPPFYLSVNGTIAGVNNGEEPKIVDLELIEVESGFDIIFGVNLSICHVLIYIDLHNIKTIGIILHLVVLVYDIESVFVDFNELFQSELVVKSLFIQITLCSDASFETESTHFNLLGVYISIRIIIHNRFFFFYLISLCFI